MAYRAVFFDLGGVVVGSPLHAIARYEREQGISAGAINRVVLTTGHGGAWSRLERGELTLADFYEAFDADCAAAGHHISARDLMLLVAEASTPRPAMLTAVARIRERGLIAGAITNNWIAEDDRTSFFRPIFDVVIESAVVGIRKPVPRIYTLACEAVRVTPAESVFLDDIGLNLKAARALGMTTIKVDDPDTALAELEGALGFSVR
jgi:putative hydrolase of the HAD superfamily